MSVSIACSAPSEHQPWNEVSAIAKACGVWGAFVVFGTNAEFAEVLAELGCGLDVGVAMRCATGPDQCGSWHRFSGGGAGSEHDC